jgi:hypothetical protein
LRPNLQNEQIVPEGLLLENVGIVLRLRTIRRRSAGVAISRQQRYVCPGNGGKTPGTNGAISSLPHHQTAFLARCATCDNQRDGTDALMPPDSKPEPQSERPAAMPLTAGKIWLDMIMAARNGEPYVKFQYGDRSFQLTPEEAIQHAFKILETAYAAECEGFLWEFLKPRVDLPDETLAHILLDFRKWRAQRRRVTDPDASTRHKM